MSTLFCSVGSARLLLFQNDEFGGAEEAHSHAAADAFGDIDAAAVVGAENLGHIGEEADELIGNDV